MAMDVTSIQELTKRPHYFDQNSGTYKENTKEPPRDYPKAKYGLVGAVVQSAVVNNPGEEKDLGPGWYDHPDQVPKPTAQSADPDPANSDVVAALKGQIEAMKAEAAARAPKPRRGRPPKTQAQPE